MKETQKHFECSDVALSFLGLSRIPGTRRTPSALDGCTLALAKHTRTHTLTLIHSHTRPRGRTDLIRQNSYIPAL